MANRLALFGGEKTRNTPFPSHPIIGEEEKRAVMEVLDSGRLSTFIAAPGVFFYGGERIKRFEHICAEYHGTKFAVSFNSATAALHAAIVAVGVHAGQEVIVPPYTFTSTATCALMHNAIPVFADITDDTFCLDAKAAEKVVSKHTKAIIPVHLFGHPADMDSLLAFAHKHNLMVIEDCAQSPGARYKGRLCGTMGHCGILSFTENKNVTTGEGGMLITNDPAIAEVARMVRNHGEMILETQKERTYASKILGWNYRLTEMDAALGVVQMGKLDALNAERVRLAEHFADGIKGIPGLRPSIRKSDCTHAYYIYPFFFQEKEAGITRAEFVKALAAEGVPAGAGYVRPLYLSPLYHENRPDAFRFYEGNATYDKGICPVAERMHEQDLILLGMLRPPTTINDVDDILEAIQKVLANREEIVEARAQAQHTIA